MLLFLNIYIFIAIALNEAVILVAVYFSMKNIVATFSRRKDGATVNVIQ